MTRNPTMWTTGVAIISAVMLAWSPAAAAPRRGDAKGIAKLTEARRKAAASAARQDRKTMEAQAQQQRKTARVEGRQDRKTVAARADAAAAVAKAQTKAAQVKAAARSVRRPMVVVQKPRPPARSLPRIGAGVRFGLAHGSRYTWIVPRYVTRTERVLVEPGHYEWRTETVLIEPGRFEPQHVGPTEEIIYDSQGNPHKVIVTPRNPEKVWVAARYETRRRKVWVPDRYELREVRVLQPGRWAPSIPPARNSGFSLSALFKF